MNETPFAVTEQIKKNPLSNSINYTNQDYGSLKARMLELIQQKFGKDFNDFSESSLAMMLIEMWAFLADQLSFKIDQIANELFIDTVTEIGNVMRLADLVGFKPTPPTPARAMFSLTINHAMPADFQVATPLLITFQAAGGGEKYMELFQADERNNPIYGKSIVIPAGSVFVNNVVGIEGRTNSATFQSNGLPWQQFPVSVPNVLWGSIDVSVAGNRWQPVEFFTSWQPEAEYRVEYIDRYKAVVIFGNNITGLVPPKGSQIKIRYRVGGGSDGNVITGSIHQTLPVFSPGLPQMATCEVINYTKGEGGYNGDSVEDIRMKLPLFMKTQDRAVTGQDYKALCEGFVSSTNGAVGKATVALRNQGCAGNIVDIYLLAKDGPVGLSKAGDNLKKELSNMLVKKKMFSDYICLRDGEIMLTDIALNVTASGAFKQQDALIREKINRRLAALLSLRNFEFGQPLRESDVIKVMADVKEIEEIDVAFTTTQSLEGGHGNVKVISPAFNEIVRPDNIAISLQYR